MGNWPTKKKKLAAKVNEMPTREAATEFLLAVLRADVGDFLSVHEGVVHLNHEAVQSKARLIKSISTDGYGTVFTLELHNKLEAVDLLAKLHDWYLPERHEIRHFTRGTDGEGSEEESKAKATG